ncbi:hypothetical protein MGYG_07841 [Nannizzia gypsea CBS 118893]|uniref:Uncharacterized protein n=1 Tax=Arthroderma gypseum (strain ATCC MYA-4604 / CBS 118893) TaxID=535722 RepID=E4V4B4_ARTGP|nr:hypothetical protein MGYG_07841 [Nannizzia gypsea CBS 118893]EFR04838.1 hypothetical protein MGYG_07841 [Nannizzia gypsea CBS 118893]
MRLCNQHLGHADLQPNWLVVRRFRGILLDKGCQCDTYQEQAGWSQSRVPSTPSKAAIPSLIGRKWGSWHVEAIDRIAISHGRNEAGNVTLYGLSSRQRHLHICMLYQDAPHTRTK